MKKAFIVFIMFVFCLNFVACGYASGINTIESNDTKSVKPSDTKITLSQSNIENYVNIQLVFGNVEQCISTDLKSNHLSCICYVIVSPKGNYSFESASITYTISTNTSYPEQTWIPIGNSKYSPLSDSWVSTIYLDKNGYGISSVYFEKSGNGSHPLVSNQWSTEVFTARGSITEH